MTFRPWRLDFLTQRSEKCVDYATPFVIEAAIAIAIVLSILRLYYVAITHAAFQTCFMNDRSCLPINKK